MPEICRFDGISIHMHWNDHLPPHFHAFFAGDEAIISIPSLDVIDGRLAKPQLRKVLRWAALRGDELARDWDRAMSREPLEPIEPLP